MWLKIKQLGQTAGCLWFHVPFESHFGTFKPQPLHIYIYTYIYIYIYSKLKREKIGAVSLARTQPLGFFRTKALGHWAQGHWAPGLLLDLPERGARKSLMAACRPKAAAEKKRKSKRELVPPFWRCYLCDIPGVSTALEK